GRMSSSMLNSRPTRRLLFCAALTLAFAAACDEDTGYNTATAPAQTSSASPPGRSLIAVRVEDNAFSPPNLTVPAGATVTWGWSGKNAHSVVAAWQGAAVQSKQFTGSGAFDFRFDAAGTFEYQCGVHGAAMAGKITVKP
ncbi:MAG: plastocyanin/azurin family copper-binding protein, partial [Tepidiformaceae bacterium]